MNAKKRRNEVTIEIVVGAFMFTLLLALLTISVVISQNKFWEERIFVEAIFPDVGGLKEGEGVFLRGVKVGNVNRISVSDDEQGVRVRLRLTRDVRLYDDYSLHVESSSMLGGMRLIIHQGSPSHPEIPRDQYDHLVGQPTPNLMNEATRTIQMIRKSLVEDGTLNNIRDLTANLREVTTEINQGRGTIGKLVREDGLYEDARALLADLRAAGENIRGIAEDARGILARLRDGKGMIGKLLSEDETLYNDLAKILSEVAAASADARAILARLERGEGTLGKLLGPDDAMYQDLRETAAALRTFTSDLNQQQGTLGRLIREDGLYVKIEGLIDEVRATVDDFRETSPITTFSSIFFGAF